MTSAVSETVQGTPRPRLSLAVLSTVLFVTFLDNTIVTAALANIQADLHAGVSSLQWIVSSYSLTFAALMLTFGTLADRFGRRAAMLAGLATFCAGSIIAAAATDTAMLIAGRITMGFGAAASEPGTLSMIRQLYPVREERARALGVWSAISGLALASGPVIGGALVGLWSWRAIFLFNIAMAVVAIAGVSAVLPESADPADRPFDLRGFLLGSVVLVTATYATIAGETAGYLSWWIDLLFAVAVAAAGAFVVVERAAEQPVLDVRYFRRREFLGGNLVAFTAYFSLFAVFYFIPLYLELVGSVSPYHVAIDFLPMAVAMIGASALCGRWIAAAGAKVPLAVGCFLAGGAVLVTNALLTDTSGLLPLGWSLGLTGIGLGLAVVPVTFLVLGAVPARRSGMAASAVNTSRQLGAVAGVAVLGSIVNAQLTVNLLRKLSAAGVPKHVQQEVITAVTTGTAPTSSEVGRYVVEVLATAYNAFSRGLDIVLLFAGALLLASALLALAIRGDRRTRAIEL